MDDELLSFEALEWLTTMKFSCRDRETRRSLIQTAKLLFPDDNISINGRKWLASPFVNYTERSHEERLILIDAAKILFPIRE